ncbi:MAG: JAB domain-containing protein [Akkermansia sp.]
MPTASSWRTIIQWRPDPSQADNALNKSIQESAQLLGIRFLDHIIIGKPTSVVQRNYYSYNSYGMKKPV